MVVQDVVKANRQTNGKGQSSSVSAMQTRLNKIEYKHNRDAKMQLYEIGSR